MKEIIWDKSLSVGIDFIDAEHKVLINLINNFHTKSDNKNSTAKILELLEELSIYADTHFKSEESYMERSGYPDYKKHKQEHEKFTKAVEKFYSDFYNGKLFLSLKISKFLKKWIVNHIMKCDMLYSSHLIKTYK